MYYFVGAVSEARRRDDGVARAEEKFRALLRASRLATLTRLIRSTLPPPVTQSSRTKTRFRSLSSPRGPNPVVSLAPLDPALQLDRLRIVGDRRSTAFGLSSSPQPAPPDTSRCAAVNQIPVQVKLDDRTPSLSPCSLRPLHLTRPALNQHLNAPAARFLAFSRPTSRQLRSQMALALLESPSIMKPLSKLG